MNDKTVLASIILGVCLIISAFLISSGMKSLSRGLSSAGTSIGNGISSSGSKTVRVDMSVSGGNQPLRIEN